TGIAFLFNGENGPVVNGGLHDVTIDHNTVFQTNSIIATGDSPSDGLVFRNNLLPPNAYGIKGDGQGTGNDKHSTYFPGSMFNKNITAGGRSANYPADNFFPPSLDQVGFVNRAGANYRLAATSPYKNAGTDGKDIGCDFDALNAAINGVGLINSV